MSFPILKKVELHNVPLNGNQISGTYYLTVERHPTRKHFHGLISRKPEPTPQTLKSNWVQTRLKVKTCWAKTAKRVGLKRWKWGGETWGRFWWPMNHFICGCSLHMRAMFATHISHFSGDSFCILSFRIYLS